MGGVLDVKKNSQGPWYVVRKDVEGNRLYVTNRYDEERFDGCRKEVGVEQIHWIEGGGGREGEWFLKIRHGPRLAKGVLKLEAGGAGDRGVVVLEEKDGGLAPGQYIAFYDEEAVCWGSAVIAESAIED